MSFSSTKTAEADGVTKEAALRSAFEQLGVPPDAWEGDSAEEIRDTALRVLQVHPSALTVRVLSEGTKGLLGLGAKLARVRVTIEQREEASPEGVLKAILELMGVEADVVRTERDGEIILNIETEDVAILIGRHGKTLDALQYLVNSILNKSSLVKRKIIVNAGSYREKREDMLTEMAHQAARRVRATGRDVTLEPMNPRDRRIIHLALRDDEDVRTFSRGEGPFRAVVIVPRDKYVPES